jgi:hypothetical protein
MLYQCVGVNVISKTINMVGGGGINSPHPPTSRYQNFPAHGRTGQSGVPLVRQRSTPMASSGSQPLDRWHTGQSCALSGVPLNSTREQRALGFLRRETTFPGPIWSHW